MFGAGNQRLVFVMQFVVVDLVKPFLARQKCAEQPDWPIVGTSALRMKSGIAHRH